MTNNLTHTELNALTDLQRAFLTLLIEKETKKRYENLTYLKKHYIYSLLINYDISTLTKGGQKQLKNIIKKIIK